MTTPDLLEVQLLQLPVPLWAAAQEHHDELLREFTLMSVATGDDDAGSTHEVPARLVALMDRITRQYAGASDVQRAELFAAAAAGRPELDLVYHVPAAMSAVATELGHMLDLADAFCREGQHLLTLATTADLLAYRTWHLGQFVDQCAGGAPVSWPAWLSACG